MAYRIAIPGFTATDTSRKLLGDDPLLPTQGALLLLDPTHTMASWPAGAPATGTMVPNVAAKQAAAMTGQAVANVDKIEFRNNMVAANEGLVERTGKGGLHVIVSHVNGVTGQYARMGYNAAISAYLDANPTHDFYVSLQGKMTRNNVTAASGYSWMAGMASTAGQYWSAVVQARASSALTSQPNNADRLGVTPTFTPGVGGNFHVSTAHSQRLAGWTGGLVNILARWGAFSSSARNVGPSWVLYRFYIEDLTVSGRTYAVVDALDKEVYKHHLLTAGGRYYADTYTDPATIP